MTDKHPFWQQTQLLRPAREQRTGHAGGVLWFTGLSGSGKSSLASATEARLFEQGFLTFLLDGDNMRHGLCSDLGFSVPDRQENIRRLSEVAKLFTEAGILTLVAAISPLRQDRERARALFPHSMFLEIYCNCPQEICEQRDSKGLYRRARANEITQFTGVDSPYEVPSDPDLALDTHTLSVERNVAIIMDRVRQYKLMSTARTAQQA